MFIVIIIVKLYFCNLVVSFLYIVDMLYLETLSYSNHCHTVFLQFNFSLIVDNIMLYFETLSSSKQGVEMIQNNKRNAVQISVSGDESSQSVVFKRGELNFDASSSGPSADSGNSLGGGLLAGRSAGDSGIRSSNDSRLVYRFCA